MKLLIVIKFLIRSMKVYLKIKKPFSQMAQKNPPKYVVLAIYAPSLQESHIFRISSYASIFTAEATTINKAIDIITSNSFKSSVIFTDSLSVVQALANCSPINKNNNHLIIHMKNKLFSAHTLGLDIELIWIPAHIGIQGNEIADRLAKRAITHGNDLNSPLPFSDFYSFCKEKVDHQFHSLLERWKNIKGIHYFKNYSNINSLSKPWFLPFHAF